MTSKSNHHFYSSLPSQKLKLGDLLVRDDLFVKVPDDWTVIITDIKNSTEAVFNGRHETVNLLATGSIVTVLNIAFKEKTTVPFFFGGEGATFLVPPTLRSEALSALSLFKADTLANFDLNIRVGQVPASTIYKSGHKLKIAKFHMSRASSIPVVMGDGLLFAETIIKGDDYLAEDFTSPESKLDLSGMQCRWDKIAPPQDKEEIVTLLVIPTSYEHQASAFRKVINELDACYGSQSDRQPISVPQLRQKTTFGRLGAEMRVRIGRIKLLELLREKLISWYAFIYLRTIKGQRYLEKLVEMSDTLVLDGKINTVISGTKTQREHLQRFLNALEESGEILYGIHMSNASVMSCYVRDLDDGHIHFVDGSEGGYTSAARMLKAKIASSS